jgi:hypothetical protein
VVLCGTVRLGGIWWGEGISVWAGEAGRGSARRGTVWFGFQGGAGLGTTRSGVDWRGFHGAVRLGSAGRDQVW